MQPGSGWSGSQENRHPGTTSTGGRISVSARTAVDFAVPFSPRISTPPIAGEIAARISASWRSSMPTTAVNGNPVEAEAGRIGSGSLRRAGVHARHASYAGPHRGPADDCGCPGSRAPSPGHSGGTAPDSQHAGHRCSSTTVGPIMAPPPYPASDQAHTPSAGPHESAGAEALREGGGGRVVLD